MKLSFIQKQLNFLVGKYFIFLVILVFLVILGIGYLIFIKQLVTEIQEIGVVDLQSREQRLESRLESLSRLKKLNEKYIQLNAEQLSQLEYVIPDRSEIPFLVIEIKNFLEENDLAVIDIDVGAITAVSSTDAVGTPVTINQLPIVLGISGLDSYSKLKDFLDKLSLNLPLLELNSLTYSPLADTYSLNLTTYYQ